MKNTRYLTKLSLKDDIEMRRKGNRRSGRAYRRTVFRALKKRINRLLNKQDGI